MNVLFPTEPAENTLNNSRHYVARLNSPPEFAFEIILPRRLKKCPALGLARFSCDSGNGLVIDVLVRRLVRELQPADLIVAELETQSSRILERRIVTELPIRDIDVLFASAGDSISRRRTICDGNRLFEVTATASQDLFSEAAQNALITLTSFRLLSPIGQPFVENRLSWSQSSRSRVQFEYPESWRVRNRVDDENVVSLELVSEFENSITGQMRIEVHPALPGNSAIRILTGYSDTLKANGMCLTGSAVVPVEPSQGFDRSSLYTPTATFQSHQFDAPVLMLEGSNRVVLLGLVGTAMKHSPEWWAINKRAFEIVRDSLKVE